MDTTGWHGCHRGIQGIGNGRTVIGKNCFNLLDQSIGILCYSVCTECDLFCVVVLYEKSIIKGQVGFRDREKLLIGRSDLMLDAAIVIGKIPDGSGYDRQSSVVCVRMALQIFFRIFFKGSVSLYT